jgi:hypothetical protein
MYFFCSLHHSNISKSLLIWACLSSILIASTVFAQDKAPSKANAAVIKPYDGTWDSLSPKQQKVLMPLEADWDYLKDDSRKKWVQVANLYPKMSRQDQERLQARMNAWSKLSQRDRRVARENYLTSLKFPVDKKVEAWSAYQKLSAEQKKKLMEADDAKKRPRASNAPTLQKHPIIEKTKPAAKSPIVIIRTEEKIEGIGNNSTINESTSTE